MAEYIEKEAAIDCLNFVCVPQCRKYAQEEIKKIPAADVAPVRHGRWEKKWHLVYRQDVPCCSECNHFSPLEWDYCPNCGCKMDGGET